MTEHTGEKTVEQYLATFKTLLGGRLPEKIQPTAKVSTQPPLEKDPWPAASQGTAPILTTKHEDEHRDLNPNLDHSLVRAPLLYPPLTATSSPAPYIPTQPLRAKVETSTVSNYGDGADGARFCPLMAVVKFPYKFIGYEYRQPVASAFFDAGKVWNREWRLYYVYNEEAAVDGPVVFVPEHQFLALVDDINTAFPDLAWALQEQHEQHGLVINFPHANNGLAPRYMGVSHSRQDYDRLCSSVDLKASSTALTHADSDLTKFLELVDLASNAGRKKPRSKMLMQANVATRAQQVARQLDSARSYVGVASSPPKMPDDTSSASTEHVANENQPRTDPNEHVVLVALDIESYERDHNKITEVGIATLDTHSVRNLAAGALAENWRQHIQATHYRIAEHKHLVNKDFVKGCPNDFEFGTSEEVSIVDIASVLASYIKTAARPLQHLEAEHSNTQGLRKVVLVGHDISQDVSYCHKLGFSILNRSNLVDVLDTKNIFRVYSSEVNPRSLASILHHFDMTAWNLHNAGNDAVYTLWALLAICSEPFDSTGM